MFSLLTEASAQLVPCNTIDECNLDAFTVLVQNIVNFIITLAGIAFIILLVWFGIQLVFFGYNSSKRSEAINRIKKGVFGLVITLLAWTIVNLFFVILGSEINPFSFGKVAEPVKVVEPVPTLQPKPERLPESATQYTFIVS